jgi:cytochrome P450
LEIDLGLLPGTLQRLVELHHRYGDIYRLATRGAAAETYVVAHPNYAQQVLSTQHADYRRLLLDGRMSLVLGNGLLMSEGSGQKAQRKLLQRCFHGEASAGLLRYMAGCNAKLLERWRACARSGESIELTRDMLDLSLDFNLRAVFSVDADGGMLDDVGAQFLHRLTAPVREDTRSNLLFVKQAKRARARIAELIARRRVRFDRPFDVLTMLMDARHRDNGDAMSDQQIIDEILSILMAGHETVATALKSIWYSISRDPAVAQAVHEEVDRVIGSADPSVSHVGSLQYTKTVIQEALRLYPPIWVISHMAEVASRIGAYHVPAGTIVFVCPYLVHRHPEFWLEPEIFDPGRFGPEAVAGRHSHAYLPYARGPRSCIGGELSTHEMLLHVATVARELKVVHVDGAPGDYAAGFALRSQTPIHMRLETRT